MNTIAVTGGGGFIGLALVKALLGRGYRVRILGRHRYPEAEHLGARCFVGDIRDSRYVTNSLEQVDTVFHVAAKAGIWGSWQEYYSTNVSGTVNVLSGCRIQGVQRLIYTSSPSVVFDAHDLEGVDETVPYATRPLCHYQTTKILAEKLVLAANNDRLLTAALRPHLVWGPGDTNLIPRLLARGRAGQLRIVGKGTNRVAVSYIDNVVTAHLLVAEDLEHHKTAAGRPFFVSQDEPVCLWAWINSLFTLLDIPQVEKRISLRAARLAGLLMEGCYTLLSKDDEPPMTRFLAEQLARSHWFSLDNIKNIGYRTEVHTEEGMTRLLAWLSETRRFCSP